MTKEIELNKRLLFFIASQFISTKYISDIKILGSGNINLTFHVVTKGDYLDHSFVIQRLSKIFSKPENLTSNVKLIGNHLNNKKKYLLDSGNKIDRRMEIPLIVFNSLGKTNLYYHEGNYWRAFSYINNTKSIAKIEKSYQAKEVGYGLGLFHSMLIDMPADDLKVNIDNFHDVKHYFEEYDDCFFENRFIKVLESKTKIRVLKLVDLINSRRQSVINSFNYLNNTSKNIGVIHGDPKLGNFLFESEDGNFASLIDLDTLQKGNLFVDLSDCLRSCCNKTGEVIGSCNSVFFDYSILENILIGYLKNGKQLFSYTEFKLLPDFIYLIIFELGLRFFTDFLNKKNYFKIDYPTHNLFRAENQFLLLDSFESKMHTLENLLDDLWSDNFSKQG